MLAIVAGVVANFSAEAMNYGPVAPFVIAIFPLMAAFFILLKTWPENYGNRKNLKIFSSCDEGLRQILRNRKIFLVGCIQTAVESCMYIFVFLWTPVMMPIQPPFGMVFACFMVAIMIGIFINRSIAFHIVKTNMARITKIYLIDKISKIIFQDHPSIRY